MATNNRINTTSLDFDEIKTNLKNYLKGQQKFSDYDFEGSSLSILLDVLAYNTHYNALYNNLAINEAFLDSASKRASVVSKAKELGYVPKSARSAMANLKVVMLDNSVPPVQSLSIPRYTKFTSNVNGKEYTFYTLDVYTAYNQNNQFIFEDVLVYEGTLLDYKWTADGINNIFTIPNANLDTSTLRVIVQDNAQTSAYTTYTPASSMLSVSDTDTVYFLKEIAGNLHQLEFGNDVVGKKLAAGNVITISYMVSNQAAANGARTFKYADQQAGTAEIFVSTTTPAFGGSAAESIDAIKWNAPRQYAAQNRLVTLDDYRSIIYSQYPNAHTINVWGGEENHPPTYGDVYISVKPTNAETLSVGQKDYLLSEVLGPRKIVTVHPKLVDPTYIRVELNTTFYYNPDNTYRKKEDIASLVRQTIADYDATTLSKFGGILKSSALARAIDATENSITSSITTMLLHVDIEPQYNLSYEYKIQLGNPIYNSGVPENSILSTGVNALNAAGTVYFDDVPDAEGTDTGVLRMFRYIGGKKSFIKNVGTVKYSTGLIVFNDVIITGLVDSTFTFKIKPQSNDVVSARNQIVTIPSELVTVDGQVDTDADNYKFTSSRN